MNEIFNETTHTFAEDTPQFLMAAIKGGSLQKKQPWNAMAPTHHQMVSEYLSQIPSSI